jgi:hypothetical protein
MAQPIPVPSEAFDFTPRELWPIIWEMYPRGIEMPASVPKKIWESEWKRRNPELAKSKCPPPPPPLLRCYWGKLRGNALVDRKRKRGEDEPNIPPVFPQPISRRFWDRYFELFPCGHPAPMQEPYKAPAFDTQPSNKYLLIKGSLHVNISPNPACPIWRPSTGVDAWNERGMFLRTG